ncbi:MAG TPA: J domain-containing protein, partial [Pirellulaceae bacterium]
MSRAAARDLYSIIGVGPDATAKEIRDAYLARARVLHPDRFERQRQPQEWKKSNEMLRELNEAYSVLRNAETRQQYDDQRIEKQQRQAAAPRTNTQRAPEPPPPPAYELGELSAGQAAFGSLPKNVQDRLLKRQWSMSEDQFKVSQSSVVWNYVFIAILLCWNIYLFAAVDDAKWRAGTLFWFGGITLVVGGLIGCNCVSIFKWVKAKLKPYFYVTPIYFLK